MCVHLPACECISEPDEPMLQDTELLRSLTNGGSIWGRAKSQYTDSGSGACNHTSGSRTCIHRWISLPVRQQLDWGPLLQARQVSVNHVSCQSSEGYLVNVRRTTVSKGPMGGHVATYTVEMDVSRRAQIQLLHWSLYRLWRVKMVPFIEVEQGLAPESD